MKKNEVARELKNRLPFAENVLFSCGDLPLPGERHAADPAGRRGQTAEGTRAQGLEQERPGRSPFLYSSSLVSFTLSFHPPRATREIIVPLRLTGQVAVPY
jgi:hypothetical protein